MRGRQRGKRKAEREGWGGGVPFTAPASVSRGTVVTGWLTIRLQVTGCGESVPTEGRAHREHALSGTNHVVSYTVWSLVLTGYLSKVVYQLLHCKQFTLPNLALNRRVNSYLY